MNTSSNLLTAREEFYERAHPHPLFNAYVHRHGINVARVSDFAGATGLLSVVDCGYGRFDWDAPGEMIEAFVCEAYASDGESVVDLVAWPIRQPSKVLTMFGRTSLLGLWEVVNPSTYYGGKPLQVHRTPLEWLQSGCRGAAIVQPSLAARVLFEVDGQLAGHDRRHARELLQLVRGIVPTSKVVWPQDRLRGA